MYRINYLQTGSKWISIVLRFTTVRGSSARSNARGAVPVKIVSIGSVCKLI